MSRRSFAIRFAAALVLTMSVPLLTCIVFLLLADLPMPYLPFGNPGWLTYGFSVLSIAATSGALTWALHARVLRLGGPPGSARRLHRIRQLAGLTVAAVMLHLLLAISVTAVDSGVQLALSGLNLLWLGTMLGVFGLVILTPLYVYCHGLFGEYFGPELGAEPVLPAALRTAVVGMGICLVAAAFPLLYHLTATGRLVPELLLIAAAQVIYAVGISWMAYRSQNRSMAPLHALLRLNRADDRAGLARVQAASLDEIGVFTNLLRDLLVARLDYLRDLEASELRTRMFAEAASDYLYEMDEELNFTFISDRFEALTGIPAALLVGQSAVDLGQDYVSTDRQRHLEDLRAHRPYRNYRFSARSPDGSVRHLQISAVPLFDEAGRFRGYRGAGTDVTAVVEAQQKLLDQEIQLVQAQKMEAVGQLTGGVAHDFNNSLTSVMGNLELVLSQGNLAQRQRGYAEAALEAAQRSALLVQRLLAFSRQQTLHPAPTDLAALLVAMADRLRALLGGTVSLQLMTESPCPPCLVDPQQLEQAVLNIVVNAGDAMPAGGTLTVRVGLAELREGEAGVPEAGRYLRVEFSDTGVGIPEAQLQQVFEPFFTTKPPGAGSGLGLSMVYGFVQQSSGGITVDRIEAGGTRVTLALPVADVRPQAVAAGA